MIITSNIKYYKLIISLVTLCFIVAANYAWLNPHPDSKVYKTTQNIPFFWQYNDDAGVEILSAAYFPEIFHTYKSRMDRPTYPIIVKALGEIVGLLILPFKELTQLQKAGAGFLLLKIIIFSLFALWTFNIFERYMPKQYAFFSVFLLLTHFFSIKAFSMFHTQELQFITPTIIIYLFLKLTERYSHLRNIIFSMIVGVLMLGKPNYAIYLGFLSFSFINKKFIEVIFSFITHLIPFGIYLLYLKIINFKFYSASVSEHEQGVWLLNSDTLSLNYLSELITDSLSSFTLNLFQYYHIIIPLSLIGFFIFDKKKIKNYYLLIFILVFFTWFQEFFSNRYRAYMTADLSIILFGFSTYTIYVFTKNITFKKNILIALSLVWFFLNIFIISNFPLVHPKNHEVRNTEISNNRIYMIENHELYDEKLIELNSKERIVKPKINK